jgi:chromosome segregation ATPase
MLVKSAKVPWSAWARAGAALAPAVLLVACGLANAQPQQTESSGTKQAQLSKTAQTEPLKATPVTKGGEIRRSDSDLDQKVNQARDDIEMLELQLQTKQAQFHLAEARLAESRRWKSLFEKLWKDGFASEERYVASRDDVLMHESRVESEKAAVQEAELRVKQAKRRLAYGEFPPAPQESRLAEIEQRLGSLEKGLDQLQQEFRSLRRLIRVRWKDADNPLPTPVPPAR